VSEPYAVEVESLDLEGRGVARHDGKVTFVAGALPGERVLCERTRSKPSYDTARLRDIVRPSTLRTEPRCPHFGLEAGSCGGCAMQHLQPRAQLAVKQRVLEDTLWHLARLRPEVVLRPIEGPAWGYRQRARLAVRDVAKKGGVLVGFHERASSFVADMRECHVLPAAVSRLLVPLRELVGSLSVRRRLPQIELAIGSVAGGTRIVLVLRHLEPLSEGDRQALRAFAAQHEVSIWLQPGGPATAHALDGDDRLALMLHEYGVELPFRPTDFTQVNHQVNEVLVRRALRLLEVHEDDRAVDFFCGLGNFTLPLAKVAKQVVGLEGHAGLVERAVAAAVHNGLVERARFEACDLFQWSTAQWERLDDSLGGVTRVLLDPPREGALAVSQALAASRRRPQRLVYVSCNPATLARDCAVLVHEGGWRLAAAGVVNMFPHTAHVESIALLVPGAENPTGDAARHAPMLDSQAKL
jgi:23S rRNA (uracil1939-C5)-methyltransferase